MIVPVKVNPRASINKVERDDADGFIIWTTAVADKGKANKAVVKALADLLGLPKSAVSLKTGATARRKLFEIPD